MSDEGAVQAALLSHRLRGFADIEQSPSALRRACSSQVPYLEVDTRASRDGVLFIYHDPETGEDIDAPCTLASSSAAEIERLRYVNGEPVLSLEHALDVFRRRAVEDQRLCLDVKDFGFEETHLALVRRAGVGEAVYFVSWIPQTLLRLRALGCTAPLFLSHWNLLSWRHRGRVLTRILRDRLFRLGSHVAIGRDRYDADLGAWSHGLRHRLLCQELPDALADELAQGGGGICVHRHLVDARLVAYCRRRALRLWVYTAETGEAFARLAAQAGVDVVFCDDAPAALSYLNGAPRGS